MARSKNSARGIASFSWAARVIPLAGGHTSPKRSAPSLASPGVAPLGSWRSSSDRSARFPSRVVVVVPGHMGKGDDRDGRFLWPTKRTPLVTWHTSARRPREVHSPPGALPIGRSRNGAIASACFRDRSEGPLRSTPSSSPIHRGELFDRVSRSLRATERKSANRREEVHEPVRGTSPTRERSSASLPRRLPTAGPGACPAW